MSTQELTSTNNLQEFSVDNRKGQYTLWQTLGIWLAAGVPMWLLSWVAYPAMSAGLPPFEAGLLRVKLFTVGLIWEFLLAMIILYHEEGDIRLNTIRRRFWLNHPVSARTGETQKSLWWWIIPLIALVGFLEIGLRSTVVQAWTAIFPFFAEPKGYDMSAMFAPELRAQMVGDWGLFGLFFVEAAFNTILGEEFIFRGVLLPKMKGAFGKWDWVANGVIFGFYHFHQPWGILSSVLSGLIYAFSAKHFRSTWYSIILHSGQSVFQMFLILGLVLGLA
ncbi:MAG TPA: CPBP family intramembrane glutamic endopeptidase [Anaerolineales bacterium]|nr:CPBP family intramembrane glutamic endopeptidase [Anaerolineales bacterium]